MRRIDLILACALLISGCATHKVLHLAGTGTEAQQAAAIFWPTSRYNERAYGYTDNRLVTKSLDGAAIDSDVSHIEISAGMHTVEIFHDRHQFCVWEALGRAFGYYYCFKDEGEAQLTWLAEAGHSYMPFAVHRCGTNWYWIEDTGRSASAELQSAAGYLSMAPEFAFIDDVRKRPAASKRVVYGTAAPDKCSPAP